MSADDPMRIPMEDYRAWYRVFGTKSPKHVRIRIMTAIMSEGFAILAQAPIGCQ